MIFEVALDEIDHTGELRYVPRHFADDEASAKKVGEEFVAAGRSVLINALHGGVRPVDGWYWDREANRFDPRGAWVYTRSPFAVRPKPVTEARHE